MTPIPLLQSLQRELETPRDARPFGSGWLSGCGAIVAAVVGLVLVIALRFPAFLSTPQLDLVRNSDYFRPVLHSILLLAYGWALTSLILRTNKVLGMTALLLAVMASLLGGSTASTTGTHSGVFFGLDFFVLNTLFTGFLFIPLERLVPRRNEQTVLRTEWREDLFYYLVSSLMVQVLTFLSLAPSEIIKAHTTWSDFRAAIGVQPWLLQVV